MAKVFTKSEVKVIKSLYQLNRLATAYEISKWAELSWTTVKNVLNKLKRKEIVKTKFIKGKKYWIIVE